MDPFAASDDVFEGNGNVELQNGNDFAPPFEDAFAPPAPAPQETDPFGTVAPAAPVEEDFFGEPAAAAPPPVAPPMEADADLFSAPSEFAPSTEPPVMEDIQAPPAPPAPPVNDAITEWRAKQYEVMMQKEEEEKVLKDKAKQEAEEHKELFYAQRVKQIEAKIQSNREKETVTKEEATGEVWEEALKMIDTTNKLTESGTDLSRMHQVLLKKKHQPN
mmetsp:Transcript_7867/g.16080  ORF Transcript_7867/g.16080 Transcript_7867/m.16080 type:complete len:218 (-) Transcript_7867:433-1086(-)